MTGFRDSAKIKFSKSANFFSQPPTPPQNLNGGGHKVCIPVFSCFFVFHSIGTAYPMLRYQAKSPQMMHTFCPIANKPRLLKKQTLDQRFVWNGFWKVICTLFVHHRYACDFFKGFVMDVFYEVLKKKIRKRLMGFFDRIFFKNLGLRTGLRWSGEKTVFRRKTTFFGDTIIHPPIQL